MPQWFEDFNRDDQPLLKENGDPINVGDYIEIDESDDMPVDNMPDDKKNFVWNINDGKWRNTKGGKRTRKNKRTKKINKKNKRTKKYKKNKRTYKRKTRY
jgi:hypothetical protein